MSTTDKPDEVTAGHAGAPAADESHVATGHETSDANVNAMVTFAITMVVTLLIVVGIAGLLFEFFRTQSDSGNSIIHNDSLQGSIEIDPNTIKQPIPDGPPLQPSAADPLQDYQELAQMNSINTIRANSYRENELMPDGKVHTHIPVEWAIKLMVAQGLPQNNATNIPVPVGTFTKVLGGSGGSWTGR